MQTPILYWFRDNLRLRDNPSLQAALRTGRPVIPVLILPDFLTQSPELRSPAQPYLGFWRRKFHLESIADLSESLAKLNCELLIFSGSSLNILNALADALNSSSIYCSEEVCTYERHEQAQLVSAGIEVHTFNDSALFAPKDLPFALEELPMVFSEYRKRVEKQCEVRNELALPDSIFTLNNHDLNKALEKADLRQYEINMREYAQEFHPQSAHPLIGGERAAWQHLNNYIWETERLASYKKTRNGLIGKSYSSKLSAYLARGCLSPRSIWHAVRKFEQQVVKNQSTYWLLFEVLWRDFFRCVAAKYGSKIFKLGGILENEPPVQPNNLLFKRWLNGETDSDFVNANMRELAATGFMSNRGRQNVASYLTHDLRQDWRRGARYFEAQLIDYDCASNWGNWLYVAGVGNASRARKFNVNTQAERYDRQGTYRKLWLS